MVNEEATKQNLLKIKNITEKEGKSIAREVIIKLKSGLAGTRLVKTLPPFLVELLGKKYLLWGGDYHWKDYYREGKNKYQAHVNYVIRFFQEKSGKLLDVGCGDGLILSHIRETSNLECLGIDNSLLAIEYAHQHNVEECQLIDLENYDESGFNYIFMGDLLEHLKEPAIALQKAKEQWLVDDGLLFVSCPTKRGIGDLRLFIRDSILELIGSVFAVNTFDIRPECQKMYITAYKPEFAKELEEIRIQNEKKEDSEQKNENKNLKGDY